MATITALRLFLPCRNISPESMTDRLTELEGLCQHWHQQMGVNLRCLILDDSGTTGTAEAYAAWCEQHLPRGHTHYLPITHYQLQPAPFASYAQGLHWAATQFAELRHWLRHAYFGCIELTGSYTLASLDEAVQCLREPDAFDSSVGFRLLPPFPPQNIWHLATQQARQLGEIDKFSAEGPIVQLYSALYLIKVSASLQLYQLWLQKSGAVPPGGEAFVVASLAYYAGADLSGFYVTDQAPGDSAADSAGMAYHLEKVPPFLHEREHPSDTDTIP